MLGTSLDAAGLSRVCPSRQEQDPARLAQIAHVPSLFILIERRLRALERLIEAELANTGRESPFSCGRAMIWIGGISSLNGWSLEIQLTGNSNSAE